MEQKQTPNQNQKKAQTTNPSSEKPNALFKDDQVPNSEITEESKKKAAKIEADKISKKKEAMKAKIMADEVEKEKQRKLEAEVKAEMAADAAKEEAERLKEEMKKEAEDQKKIAAELTKKVTHVLRDRHVYKSTKGKSGVYLVSEGAIPGKITVNKAQANFQAQGDARRYEILKMGDQAAPLVNNAEAEETQAKLKAQEDEIAQLKAQLETQSAERKRS